MRLTGLSRMARVALGCLAGGGAAVLLGRALGRARLQGEGAEAAPLGAEVILLTVGGTLVFLIGIVAAILTLFPGLSR